MLWRARRRKVWERVEKESEMRWQGLGGEGEREGMGREK